MAPAPPGRQPRYDISVCDVSGTGWRVVFDPQEQHVRIHVNSLSELMYVVLCVSATLSAAAIIRMVAARRRALTAANSDDKSHEAPVGR